MAVPSVDKSKCTFRLSQVLVVAACLYMVLVVPMAMYDNTTRTVHPPHAANLTSKFGKIFAMTKRGGPDHEGWKRCPHPPPNLISQIPVDQSNTTFNDLKTAFPEVTSGGRWEPKNCTSHSNVAVLIPYRDRKEHLKIFLRHMHRFLQKQLLNYTIYVIEQNNGTKFNRGFLFNVGVSRALLERKFDCFIFHDVDLLPENENNLYHCANISTHLSTGLSKWNYSIIYPNSFGGVTMMRREDFLHINGFSNRYHGWGGEDDDHRWRILKKGLKLQKMSPKIGRYTALGHQRAQPNPKRHVLLQFTRTHRYIHKEGLSTIDYQLLNAEKRPLYTWFLIKPNYVD